MSQQNNNTSFAATLAKYASNAATEAAANAATATAIKNISIEEKTPIKNGFQLIKIDEDDLELSGLKPKGLSRQITMPGPLILVKDSDLYILCDGTKKIIKSWITDKEVPNRRLNEKTGYLEKIVSTIEEEDRRLLIPNAILAEDYYKSWANKTNVFLV